MANSNPSKAHVLLLPYPSQGHINPMLQLGQRLISKGPMATLVTTHFILSSIQPQFGPVQAKPLSDGFDRVGFTPAVSLEAYLARFEDVGSRTLADLIKDEARSTRPFTCIVYDTFVPWALDVARWFDLPAVAFSTQSCAVSAVYYYLNQGLAELPRVGSSISVAGSVPLAISDFPSFALGDGSCPTHSGLALKQFRQKKNDWVLFNSFDELESEVSFFLIFFFLQFLV